MYKEISAELKYNFACFIYYGFELNFLFSLVCQQSLETNMRLQYLIELVET